MHPLAVKFLNRLKGPSVPTAIRRRQTALPVEKSSRLEDALRHLYFADCPSGYLETKVGRDDLEAHLGERLEKDRQYVIPWLARFVSLAEAKVLEIGAGTGASTVALAEQGAQVEAVDIDASALEVAETRCELHGVRANFTTGNAADLPPTLRSGKYDLVVFYASLEHMTHEERLTSIADTWKLVKPGGHWCVIGTPNRLWHFDYHTSFLPFYFWLPDDLAYRYSRRSSRTGFAECYRETATPEGMLDFLRRGRGVSYHEVELALGSLSNLKFPVSLATHLRRNLLRRLKHYMSLDGKYERMLQRLAPGTPEVFVHKSLDLAIQKPVSP